MRFAGVLSQRRAFHAYSAQLTTYNPSASSLPSTRIDHIMQAVGGGPGAEHRFTRVCGGHAVLGRKRHKQF
jgi:hypothetical protein